MGHQFEKQLFPENSDFQTTFRKSFSQIALVKERLPNLLLVFSIKHTITGPGLAGKHVPQLFAMHNDSKANGFKANL